MRQRVFVWDDFELNYNQSTIVFTKVRTSFACNEFLCDRNDQIESAVHEGIHHSSLPLWISSFGKPRCEGAGMMGQFFFCSRSFASQALTSCDSVFVMFLCLCLLGVTQNVSWKLVVGRKHLQVSSEVQYSCWKHMSNKIKGRRGRICCANVLGARFFGSIVDFPFCLPDSI